MRYARLLICLLLIAAQIPFQTPAAHAAPSSSIVIEQMYPGSSGALTQEFIELYNNSSMPVDVTGWCVYYVSSSGATTTKLACLTAPDSSTRLWVKAGGYVVFASNEYKAAQPVNADATFNGAMSSSAGHVRLTDAAGSEIDRIG